MLMTIVGIEWSSVALYQFNADFRLKLSLNLVWAELGPAQPLIVSYFTPTGLGRVINPIQ